MEDQIGAPHGAGYVSGGGDGPLPDSVVTSARFQGRRLAEHAAKLSA